MTMYYAYIPRPDGSEPMGTGLQTLFKMKTDRGAIRHAIGIYGPIVKVFRYTNFYDDKTFKMIHEPKVPLPFPKITIWDKLPYVLPPLKGKKCPDCGKPVWDVSTVDQRLNKCWNCGLRFDNPEE